MSTTNSGWTQAAIVAGNAAVQGYTARQAAKEQKKVSQAAAQPRYEYQVRNPYMNELIAPLIPYILQSQQQVFQNRMKGYGSSAPDFSPFANLLAGITSNYSGVPQMGGGQTYGGKVSQSFPQGGYPGGDSVSPSERARIEQVKVDFAAGKRREGGGGSSGAMRGRHIQRRADSVFDAGNSYGGIGGGGGAGELDVLMAGKDPNYFRMMLGDSLGRIDAGNAGISNGSLDPNLRGDTWSQSGAGLSPQDMRALGQVVRNPKTLGDFLRNAAWGYAGLDGNILGKKGTTVGEIKQGAIRYGAGQIPTIGVAAGPVLNEIDKTMRWMYNYDNWGVAPQGVWNVSPHMFNAFESGRLRGGDNIAGGYGSSANDPFIASLLSASPVTNKYTSGVQMEGRDHASDLAFQMAWLSGETGDYLY